MLRSVVACEDALFLPFDASFWGTAPAYVTRYFEDARYRGESANAFQRLRTEGGYFDRDVYMTSERDQMVLYRELLIPSGISSHLVALVSFAGRARGVLSLNRRGPGRPFTRRDLDATQALAPTIAMLDAAFAASVAPPSTHAGLTPTRQRIAELVACGYQNNQIAALLDISRHTVRNHLHTIMNQLRVASRTELAALWNGRVTPSDLRQTHLERLVAELDRLAK